MVRPERIAIMAVLLMAAAAWGQASAPTSRPASRPASMPVEDVADGMVDPYDQAKERTRFLRAAGVDGELSEAEFADDQKRTDGFARPFESWRGLAAFDADKNGTINWSEADAYRLDLRKRVLHYFDANKDDKLSAAERVAANRALLSGKLTRGPAPTTAPTWTSLREMPPAERQMVLQEMAARREMEMLEQYDADHDGQLSAQERMEAAKARGGGRDPVGAALQGILLQQFDADGDGVLSDEEKADQKAFQQRMDQWGKDWRTRVMDADGDGEVTKEEMNTFGAQMLPLLLPLQPKFQKLMDLDGDGDLTREEQELFGQKVAGGVTTFVQGLIKQCDADGDGRLVGAERDALVETLNRVTEERYAKHAGAPGKYTPQATVGVLLDLMKDVGIEVDEPAATTPPAETDDRPLE